MKQHWGLCLLASMLAGIMLGVTMSYPSPSPILRGYQITIAEKLGLETESMQSAPVANSQMQPTLSPLAVSADSEEAESRKLDLSLPDIDWDDPAWNAQQDAFPNFFRPSPEEESRMNFSGKLHWDESEEAKTRPIQDTIMGAEVEFKVLLP